MASLGCNPSLHHCYLADHAKVVMELMYLLSQDKFIKQQTTSWHIHASLKCRLGIPVCFWILFNTGNPLGVHTQGFVGVSYPGEALGQRVSHIFGVSHMFGIRTCDPCDSFLTILPLSHWDGQKFGLGTKLMSCSLRIYLLVWAKTMTTSSSLLQGSDLWSL